jgi:hypothetical protein
MSQHKNKQFLLSNKHSFLWQCLSGMIKMIKSITRLRLLSERLVLLRLTRSQYYNVISDIIRNMTLKKNVCFCNKTQSSAMALQWPHLYLKREEKKE